MSKGRTKSKVNVVPWILGGVLGLSALAFYVKTSGADKVPTDQSRVASEQSRAASATDGKVHVVQPHADGMKVTYSSTEKQAPTDQDPKVFAVNEYLRQIPAVDKQGRVLAISVRDRVAILSMSKEFGLSYGSEDEKLILDGIAETLGKIDGIDSFLLTEDGQKIESLGHADLSDPTPVMRKTSAKPIEGSAPSAPR